MIYMGTVCGTMAPYMGTTAIYDLMLGIRSE